MNAELLCDFGMREMPGRTKFSNLDHEISIQFERAGMPTPLSIHVAQVVRLGTQEKMFGIDAGWCVASVKDRQSRRNRSLMHFPRKAMRQTNGSFPTAKFDDAIAELMMCSAPKPTTAIGLELYVVPEADLKGYVSQDVLQG